MSLAAFLDKLATLERPVDGVSSTGGKGDRTWATVTGKSAMPCASWPISTGPNTNFQQLAMDSTHIFAFAMVPSARAGDRLNVSGTYYLVQGKSYFGNQQASKAETLYYVEVKLRTES